MYEASGSLNSPQFASMFSSSSPPPESPSPSLIRKKAKQTRVGLEDLPDPILDQILERLPISDYIRFAAVCPRWKSVQRNHRLRHSPSLPPMLPLPLLLPYRTYHSLVLSSSWYSPFERRFYRFNLAVVKKHIYGSIHGWLLLLRLRTPSRSSYVFLSLLNPITFSEIQLPPYPILGVPGAISLSSPPTGPRCIILVGVNNSDRSILWKAGDAHWTEVRGRPLNLFTSIAFFNGKFFAECVNHGTFSVDPSVTEPQYSFEFLNMDRSQFLHARYLFNYLVECDGELLLVQEIFDRDGGQADGERELAISFGVFREDFCGMAWVRIESIGDHVLFISRNSFSLLASDVGGARKNCIYSSYSRVFPRKAGDEVNRCNSWTGYDLGTGTVFHGPRLPNAEAGHEHSQFGTVWCLPRLPPLHPAAAG